MYSIIKQAKKERKQKSKKILIPHLKEGVLYFLDCSQQDKKPNIICLAKWLVLNNG